MSYKNENMKMINCYKSWRSGASVERSGTALYDGWIQESCEGCYVWES